MKFYQMKICLRKRFIKPNAQTDNFMATSKKPPHHKMPLRALLRPYRSILLNLSGF
jgi:hypothetical protein